MVDYEPTASAGKSYRTGERTRMDLYLFHPASRNKSVHHPSADRVACLHLWIVDLWCRVYGIVREREVMTNTAGDRFVD